jgi:hypothetical protein
MPKRPPLTADEIKACLARPGMRVADATDVFRVGRNKIYNLMNSGEIKFRKVGKLTILDTKSCIRALGPAE